MRLVLGALRSGERAYDWLNARWNYTGERGSGNVTEHLVRKAALYFLKQEGLTRYQRYMPTIRGTSNKLAMHKAEMVRSGCLSPLQ
jgi:hypothetical protein